MFDSIIWEPSSIFLRDCNRERRQDVLQRIIMRSEGTPNPHSFPGVAILSELWGTGVCVLQRRGFLHAADWAEPKAIITKENHLHPASHGPNDIKMHWLPFPGHMCPRALDSHYSESSGLRGEEKNNIMFSRPLQAGHVCLLSCPHVT